MFIKDLDDINAFITVGNNLYFDKILPYFNAVEKLKLKPLIGSAQLDILAAYTGDDPTILEVIKSIKGFIVNLGLLRAFPHVQNQFGNTGIDNDPDRKWWAEKDLQRSYLTAASEYINAALETIYASLDLFQAFRDSELFTSQKELIIFKPGLFSKYSTIENKYLTWLTITPTLKYVQDSVMFSKDMRGFKSWVFNPETDLEKEAVKHLCGVIAHKTVRQLLLTNKYTFDGLGFGYKLELLPWEKQNVKASESLKEYREEQAEKAKTYFDMFWDLIKDNPVEFGLEEKPVRPCYTKTNSSFNLL